MSDATPTSDPHRWSPSRIGELVAHYRHERGLGVSELARKVGVTPSLISQIERGASRPSVATLFALAEALDVAVDVFAGRGTGPAPARPASGAAPQPASPGESRYVVRRRVRRTISIAGGVDWELLTPVQREDVEFLELVYGPHAESNEALYRHPGFEMMLVLEGRFDIHVGFETYALEMGDSISFPSSLPHRYVNPTDAESRAVTVILRDPAPEVPPSEFV